VAYDSNLVHLTGTETISGNKTFSGTVAGITKVMVGLENVDNTSDANKPVSTATQTALNLKADDSVVVKLAGAQTISGDKTFSGNVIANAKTITPTQLGYLSDMSLSFATAFNDRPVYNQLLAASNTWTGVNTFNTNNVAVTKSIGIAGATVRVDGGIYFPNTDLNRRIVFYSSGNNEYQNHSIGKGPYTMQFMVDATNNYYTFSAAATALSKTDYVVIGSNGVDIKTGSLLIAGTDIFGYRIRYYKNNGRIGKCR
jgi:hypothetical protein